DHEPGRLLGAGFLDPVHQLAFAVRLTKNDLDAETSRRRGAELLDVGELRAAVFLRLARAEQVHVRAVEDVNGLAHVGNLTKSRRKPMQGRACAPATLDSPARRERPLYRWRRAEGEAHDSFMPYGLLSSGCRCLAA